MIRKNYGYSNPKKGKSGRNNDWMRLNKQEPYSYSNRGFDIERQILSKDTQIWCLSSNPNAISDLNVEVDVFGKKVYIKPYVYTSQEDWEECNYSYTEYQGKFLLIGYQASRTSILEYWKLLEQGEDLFQAHIDQIPTKHPSERKALKRDLPKAIALAAKELGLEGGVQ